MVPCLDSLLPVPLKFGVRFLVGWKIFTPSRGSLTSAPSNSPVFLFELFSVFGVSLFSVSRGGKLICVLSCRLGSQRLLFGVLPQALSFPQGVTPFGLGRLAGLPVLFCSLRLFQFACLYGKRLVTTRFGSKILMSTIISLGVFCRDLLSFCFFLLLMSHFVFSL